MISEFSFTVEGAEEGMGYLERGVEVQGTEQIRGMWHLHRQERFTSLSEHHCLRGFQFSYSENFIYLFILLLRTSRKMSGNTRSLVLNLAFHRECPTTACS